MVASSDDSVPRVAFATSRGSPGLTDDDRLAADALVRRGVDVQPAVWDAPDIEWHRFDGVVIRSTWDYHLKPVLYARWLESFLPARRLWNPPALVLGNLDKRYLLGLADRGAPVVPTAYVDRGDASPLGVVIERRGWDEVVIKPAISASARGTWRSARATADRDQERFAEQSRAGDLLVQPYCPEIAAPGEWSLIFFGGAYSHAVLKTPADGDFRVQRHLGGRPVAAAPSARLVDEASAILSTLPSPTLYARVDGIEREGRFVLMELEINEPYLFLSFADQAASRFADAIVRVVGEGRGASA